MLNHIFPASLLAGFLLTTAGLCIAEKSPASANASVYIISPPNGAIVSSPLRVRFGLVNMGVAPAGVEREATGHHHLLVDMAELPPLDRPLPGGEQLIHFGGGQTETLLELGPGTHTLQLLLGNFAHIPHDPPVISQKVTITVR